MTDSQLPHSGPTAFSRSIYAPCAQVLFAVPRQVDGAPGEARMGAMRLRCGSGQGTMQPSDEHVVICKLDGTSPITRTLDGRREMRYPSVGSISVVPAGVAASWQVHGEDETLHLSFDAQRVDEFVDQHPELGLGRRLAPTFAATDAWLGAFHRLLDAELASPDGGGLSFRMFLAEAETLLLRYLLRRSPASVSRRGRVSPLRPHLLGRVKDFVRAHIGEDIGLQRLAEEVHMSPDHFVRSFCAAVGLTPYRWVTRQRMQTAAQLLMVSPDSVAQIAQQVGFRSASHFAAQFRQHHLMTPLEFRSAARQAGPGATQDCLSPGTSPS